MPVYCYTCNKCGATRAEVRRVADRGKSPACSICAGRMKRDIGAETVNSTDMEYQTPILSDAVGVNPNQVRKHREIHPDIPILNDGRVVFTSHSQRRRVLKKLGFFCKDAYC